MSTASALLKMAAVMIGFVVGGILGYSLGAWVACYWLYKESNLCGLLGVFVTGPFSAIVSAVIGWFLPPRLAFLYMTACGLTFVWLIFPAIFPTSLWNRLMVTIVGGCVAIYWWIRIDRGGTGAHAKP